MWLSVQSKTLSFYTDRFKTQVDIYIYSKFYNFAAATAPSINTTAAPVATAIKAAAPPFTAIDCSITFKNLRQIALWLIWLFYTGNIHEMFRIYSKFLIITLKLYWRYTIHHTHEFMTVSIITIITKHL